MDKPILPDNLEQQVAEAITKVSQKQRLKLDEALPGEKYLSLRTALDEKGMGKIGETTVVADIDPTSKEIITIAAAVARAPTKSDVYLRDSVPDLKTTGELPRTQQIPLYRSVYRKEGIINNAIKKKASIISQDGEFKVRTAKHGKKPRLKVIEELTAILKFWVDNVNHSPETGAITGSRGIKQVIRRGSRQAMIEGDLFLNQVWQKVDIPEIGKKIWLPMFLQALPAEEVEIYEGLVGISELYYWVPNSEKINTLTRTRDPVVKKIVTETMSPEIINQLKKNRKALLDPTLLVHIKHGGSDTEAYGQSDVESALTDLAYARALKSLDFVTIDSLINRILVIKIGDPNEKSDFHSLATANRRVAVFNRLLTEVGPNMLVVWAGHDVDTTDIGAHNQLLDTKERHELAAAGTKMATGVPDPILTGSAPGGNAVAWAGFVSLGAVAAELQEEWAQALTQLGQIIAQENNYEDPQVVWEFSRKLLADQEANAKLMINAYDRGLLSRRTMLGEIGKDYEVERHHREVEQELEDDEIFTLPIIPKGGPSGNQGITPTSQPGRPDRETDTKTGPDRDREDKTLQS